MADDVGVNGDLASPGGKRLFFAVEVSEEIRTALTEVIGRLQKAAHFTPLRASWVPPANYHVTLFFMGNVPQAQADRLAAVLPATVEGLRSFTLDVRHLGVFPDPKKGPPRVLWASVYKAAPELEALRQRCSNALRKANLPVPEQDFSPHVTLARFKSTKGVHVFLKMLEEHRFFKAGKCTVGRVVLMESQTGGGEARYVPYATAALEPAAPPPEARPEEASAP